MNRFFNARLCNIWSVLILAVLLRAVWGVLVPVNLVGDSYVYNEFAQSIAFKNQYAFVNGDITVYWPVGTSAIYGGLYKIFGYDYLPIVIMNVLIGAGIVWLTYILAIRYLNNKSIAKIAALIVACWPVLIEFTTILASELIFIFFILASLCVWSSQRLSLFTRSFFTGILIAAAAYNRPVAIPLMLVFPLLEFVESRNLKSSLLATLVLGISFITMIAPWAQRNYDHFGHYVLVSANGGVNLWMGNNPNANGGYMDLGDKNYGNEVERDISLKKEAVDFIIHNPLSYAKLAIKRVYITYKAETIGVVWNGALEKNLNTTLLMILKLISSLYWWVVLTFGIYGLYLLLKNKRLNIGNILIVSFGFFFLFPILTVGQDRYHMPINSFLAIFAAYAIHDYFSNNRAKKVNP